MRIGEGSTGVVYKALMHGCDEVAVKIVRAAHPTQKELEVFQREVGSCSCGLSRPQSLARPDEASHAVSWSPAVLITRV